MYKHAAQKFSGGCFYLLRKKDESVVFLGTAFIAHKEGYILTASYLIGDDYSGLMAGRTDNPEEFTSLSLDRVQAVPLEVVKADHTTNTAVLKFSKNVVLDTPDHLVGTVENITLGNSVLCFGFPFGHRDLHNLSVQRALISSKISLRDYTNLFLFDTAVHAGMAGGPLVNNDDGRVIGIIIGRFLPEEQGGDFVRGDHPDYETSFSYAVSIEYGKRMLEDLGLEVM